MTWSILGARLHRGGVLLLCRLMLLGLSVRGGWSEEEHASQEDAHHQHQGQAPGGDPLSAGRSPARRVRYPYVHTSNLSVVPFILHQNQARDFLHPPGLSAGSCTLGERGRDNSF